MTINSTPNISVGSGSASTNIGIEDFLKILTAQLNNQDPLKPVDNQEFVAQIAQFANLEQSRQVNVKLDSLVNTASVQPANLIGKAAVINDGSGNFITGTVTEISYQSGVPLLRLHTSGGQDIANVQFSQIINFHAP